MNPKALSIRPFIGAHNFDLSRHFYTDLGFQESILSPDLSLFVKDQIGFYLQRAYVKDWIDNSMIFVEVEDVNQYWKALLALELADKYEAVKLTPVRKFDWGNECYLHDPSGILWHFGEFNNR